MQIVKGLSSPMVSSASTQLSAYKGNPFDRQLRNHRIHREHCDHHNHRDLVLEAMRRDTWKSDQISRVKLQPHQSSAREQELDVFLLGGESDEDPADGDEGGFDDDLDKMVDSSIMGFTRASLTQGTSSETGPTAPASTSTAQAKAGPVTPVSVKAKIGPTTPAFTSTDQTEVRPATPASISTTYEKAKATALAFISTA
ncbi:hypothetical protein LWI28_025687 [Acer negundo]|uniref:Uncharacterized protein n=1 Tax=Acer negundo TaxID=4023 RepID=A0AAD5NQT1_ACENE|nr:hypothetical protein LWI28_025687 [Acer negundo]